MAKKMEISKNAMGNIVIRGDGFHRTVVVRTMTEEQKFEAVRDEILKLGFVFSHRIEKTLRKTLKS